LRALPKSLFGFGMIFPETATPLFGIMPQQHGEKLDNEV
jgi:hypothetical protein